MKKTPKILLTGTYSVHNKGDAAMQIATAKTVQKKWPHATVTISSPFPDKAKILYKEFEVVKSTRRNLIVGTIHLVLARLYTFIKNVFGVELRWLCYHEELKAFVDTDIIVDLSGDTLTEDYGPHVTYSHFLPILLGLAFRKPVFICAQSIGPFKLTTSFSRFILNRVTKVTAREGITFKYLKNLGVVPSKLQQTSDMAFLLDPVPAKRTEEILANEGVSRMGHDKLTIGVSISKLVEDRFAKNNPASTKGDLAEQVAALLDKYIEKYNAQIVFVSHVTGPNSEKDDRKSADRVVQHMRRKAGAKVLHGDYRPDELKAVIGTFDVMVGARMHANIAALSTGVPLIAVRYSQKTDGIMQLFGMDNYVVDIDSFVLREIEDKFAHILANRQQVNRGLLKALKKVKLESMKNIQVIEDVIVSSPNTKLRTAPVPEEDDATN